MLTPKCAVGIAIVWPISMIMRGFISLAYKIKKNDKFRRYEVFFVFCAT